MTIEFLDKQDQSNRRRVHNADELATLLVRMTSRSPFFDELVAENGYTVLVGIGGPTGCIQYSATSGDPPHMMALGNPTIEDDGHVSFLMADTPTPVSKRYCLSFEKVAQAAGYFMETGERFPGLSWEEI